MNYRLPFLCAFILILSFQSSNSEELQDSYSEAFLSGVHQFSTEFYKAVAKNNHGNFISSPISVLTVLAMLAYGADGNSREQLVKAIHLPITRQIILDDYRKFIQNLNSVSGVELHLANRLFIDNKFNIHRNFQNVTDIIFQSKAENIDFQDTHRAAEIINQWSQEETMNKITNLVKPEDMIDTVMMMINAVYFKGSWVHSFGDDLKQKTFHLSEHKAISVPMMCNVFRYNYGLVHDIPALYVEVSYQTDNSGNEFSMYFIIPREIDGLEELGNKLHEINFAGLNSSSEESINLCVPKFKIESTLDLIPTLKDMGIQDVFTRHANLSNIAPHDNLEVSEVIQKAFLSVDERGTEAAAITVIGIKGRAAGPAQLTIDRPFISAIVSKATGTPVFWARVVDPRF